MPKKKNVLMNVEGVDFYINDDNCKHCQSLSKFEQEVKKNNYNKYPHISLTI